jgi:hypothetical protein
MDGVDEADESATVDRQGRKGDRETAHSHDRDGLASTAGTASIFRLSALLHALPIG